MAVGMKLSENNLLLAALYGGTAYQGPAGTATFIQLHTADPGAAGTNAVANAGRRVAIGTMTVNSGTGVASNAADITFAAVASTQTYTHYSAWTSVTAGAGNFLRSGTCTGTGTIGQDFVISAGNLTSSYLVAA